jgi:hypothetical protein
LPESTIDYYRSIIARYRAREPNGGYTQIIMNSLDVNKAIAMLDAARLDDLANYLAAFRGWFAVGFRGVRPKYQLLPPWMRLAACLLLGTQLFRREHYRFHPDRYGRGDRERHSDLYFDQPELKDLWPRTCSLKQVITATPEVLQPRLP